MGSRRAATTAVVERARQGGGPRLLDCARGVVALHCLLLPALAEAGKRNRGKKWRRHPGDHPPRWHEKKLIWFVIFFIGSLAVRAPRPLAPPRGARRSRRRR